MVKQHLVEIKKYIDHWLVSFYNSAKHVFNFTVPLFEEKVCTEIMYKMNRIGGFAKLNSNLLKAVAEETQ